MLVQNYLSLYVISLLFYFSEYLSSNPYNALYALWGERTQTGVNLVSRGAFGILVQKTDIRILETSVLSLSISLHQYANVSKMSIP